MIFLRRHSGSRSPIRPTLNEAITQARARSPSASFRAGAARIDLTPQTPVGAKLAGFGPKRLATGVRDPIEARALVFDDGRRVVCLVSVDLLALSLESVQRVRDWVGASSEHALVVASTHTHSAPDTLGLWGPAILGVPIRSGVDRGWLEETEHAIARGVLEAVRRLEPARLKTGRCEYDGEDVVNIRKNGLIDRQLNLLAAERLDSSPIATVVNFGCHAELLGPDNTELSSDFVGDLRRSLEARLGGQAMFLQGALGAMVTPAVSERASVAERSDLCVSFGEKLAALAEQGLASSMPHASPELGYERLPVALPVQNARFRLGALLGVLAREIQLGEGRRPTIHSEVSLLTLGNIRFALLPGEPDPVVGARARRALGGAATGIVGLANDELGYLITDEALDDPEYAYERTMSLGPGTSSRLISAVAWLEARALPQPGRLGD